MDIHCKTIAPTDTRLTLATVISRVILTLDEGRVRSVCEKSRVSFNRLSSDLNRVSLATATTIRIFPEGEGKQPEVPRQGDGAFLLDADGDYAIEIDVVCKAGTGGGLTVGTKKGKQQGSGAWWVTLGSDDGELLALKRLMAPRKGNSNSKQGDGRRPSNDRGNGHSAKPTSTTIRLMFAAPEEPGPSVMTLYLVSDTFTGLDQTLEIPVVTIGGQEAPDGEQAT